MTVYMLFTDDSVASQGQMMTLHYIPRVVFLAVLEGHP